MGVPFPLDNPLRPGAERNINIGVLHLAKRGGKSEDGERRVLRCDRLPTFMNRGKERKLRRMLANWRLAAACFC